MKLVSLEFSAIGPYPSVQTIDFSDMEGLTLICGNTGSGKTFIFDAVTFALYGETSGKDRPVTSMRSLQASPTAETYVELVFEHNGQDYTIRRNPKYLRAKMRGGGSTTEQAKVVMHCPGGRDLNKVDQVLSEVVSITGLTAEQWRQVVMLAQGKFQSFIKAESKDRGKILESIFDIGLYSQIVQQLSLKSKAAAEDLTNAGSELSGSISTLNIPDASLVKELAEITKDKKKLVYEGDRIRAVMDKVAAADEADAGSARTLLETATGEFQAAEKAYKEAETLHGHFGTYAVVKNEFDRLESQREAYEVRKADLAKAHGIREKIKPAEDRSAKADKDRNTLSSEIGKQEKELQEADSGLETANQNLETAKANNPDIEAKNAEIALLESKRGTYDIVDQKSKAATDAKKEVDAADKRLTAAKSESDAVFQKVTGFRNYLKEHETAETDLAGKKAELEKVDRVLTECAALKHSYGGYVSAKNSAVSALNEKDAALKEFTEQEDKTSKMRRLFITGQAGIIASELKDGCKCPVCGSTHHPEPASMVAGCPKEEEIKAEEDRCKVLEGARSTAEAAYNEAFTKLQVKRGEVAAHAENAGIEVDPDAPDAENVIDTFTSAASKSKSVLQADIRTLEPICNKKKEINGFFEKDPHPERDAQEKVSKISDEKSGLQSNYDRLSAELETYVGGLEFKTKAELESRIAELRSSVAGLNKLLTDATAAFSKAQNRRTAASTALESSRNRMTELEAEAEAASKAYSEAITELGFASVEEYKSKVKSDEQLKMEEKGVESFFTGLNTKKGQTEQAFKQIEGKEDPQNLEELKQTFEEKDKARREALENVGGITSRVETNRKTMDSIRSRFKTIESEMSQKMEIDELFEVANGTVRDSTGSFMSFPDYVQSKYFDSILSLAERRLQHMTGDRYVIRRARDVSGGRSSHLLDLEIVDNDSLDSTPRPIASLSGGESFKASLALALGFSDAIQENAAGQKIDALFIDEGFGTLDEDESLDQAIDILEELSGGKKAVCIISHVPKLRERISRQIVIDYEKRRGSTIRFVKD